MDQNFVLNGNKLIAEFMDFKEIVNDRGINIFRDRSNRMFDKHQFEYHKSWDWLMPVVEKIESLGYFMKISTKMVSVARDNKGNHDSYLVKAQFGDDTKLQKAYSCVIGAIQYINYLKTKE